jgi:hypothetical protein
LLAHFSPLQTVPTLYVRQPPAPSQRPSVPQEAAPRSLQTLRLSELPAANGVHLPREDCSAQLRQLPPQTSLQQTPSTQKFDLQSVGFVHDPPSCSRPQLWLTQAMPATHSASLLQIVLHAPAAQR